MNVLPLSPTRRAGFGPVFLFLLGLSLSPAVAGEATGIVYHDRNGNGVRDEGEPGLPGVSVSNQREIVQTDASGRWTLPVTDDTIFFVIKPRDWMTPVNENQLPQFYYIHKPAGSPPSWGRAARASRP